MTEGLRLDSGARLCPRFIAEPGGFGAYARLRGAGCSVVVDVRVLDLYRRLVGCPPVRELVSTDRDPELAYAALNVLTLAGAIEARPSPTGRPGRPAPDRTDGPLVSLVIVSYNSADDLPGLLDSIRGQSYSNIQVTVVDNASEDGSADLVERDWPEVELVRVSANGGFAAGVNLGWERARGEFVAVLNADLRLEPDTVASWVFHAGDRPDAAAIAAKMMLGSHPAFINSLGNSINRSDWGSDNQMGLLDLGQFDQGCEVWSACFGAVLLRRGVIDQVGPMDTGYFLYYEDVDWCFRARLSGHKIVSGPNAVVHHQFGASVSSQPHNFKMQLVVRNRLRFVLLNMGARLILRYLPGYVWHDLRQVLGAVRRRDATTLGMYRRAYGDLVREFPRLRTLRRERRRVAMMHEGEVDKLNVPPPREAQLGREAVISEAAVRKYYIDLFPVPQAILSQVNRRRR